MRFIIKTTEPQEFSDWKAKANDNWIPTWDNLGNPEKQFLLNSLINEQGHICCYCGKSIELGDCHIEHFKPRSHYLALSLDYTNLLVSCNGMTSNRHCGHKKDNWFDEDKLICPLSPDCESYFEFTSAGEIINVNEPDKEAASRETILKLNLNHDNLVRRRRAALKGFLDIIDALSEDEINLFIDTLDLVDENGKLAPFCFAVKYVLQRYI